MAKTKSCNQHKKKNCEEKYFSAKHFEIKGAFKFVDYSFDFPKSVLF